MRGGATPMNLRRILYAYNAMKKKVTEKLKDRGRSTKPIWDPEADAYDTIKHHNKPKDNTIFIYRNNTSFFKRINKQIKKLNKDIDNIWNTIKTRAEAQRGQDNTPFVTFNIVKSEIDRLGYVDLKKNISNKEKTLQQLQGSDSSDSSDEDTDPRPKMRIKISEIISGFIEDEGKRNKIAEDIVYNIMQEQSDISAKELQELVLKVLKELDKETSEKIAQGIVEGAHLYIQEKLLLIDLLPLKKRYELSGGEDVYEILNDYFGPVLKDLGDEELHKDQGATHTSSGVTGRIKSVHKGRKRLKDLMNQKYMEEQTGPEQDRTPKKRMNSDGVDTWWADLQEDLNIILFVEEGEGGKYSFKPRELLESQRKEAEMAKQPESAVEKQRYALYGIVFNIIGDLNHPRAAISNINRDNSLLSKITGRSKHLDKVKKLSKNMKENERQRVRKQNAKKVYDKWLADGNTEAPTRPARPPRKK